MPRFLVLLAVLATAMPSFAFSRMQEFRPATPAELAMKSVDFAPGVSAAVLDWVQVDDDTLSKSTEYFRIKIFSEEGKKYGDVEVQYVSGYPFSGRVTDISARTIQPDGKVIPFEGKVYDKVVLKSGGVRLKAKAFSLPGVQAGSILEYRYERHWTPDLLLNTVWTVQRDIPVLHAHFTLKPWTEGDFSSFFSSFNLAKVPEKAKRGVYELELTNLPPWQSEAFAPPEAQLKSRVNFYYIAGRLNPENYWKESFTGWTRDADAFIGRASAMRDHLQPLTGKDDLETLRNIYAKVQSLENLSFDDDDEFKDQRSAGDVLKKKRGYRMELNRTFVALARGAGMDASVMRVSPRNEFFFSPKILDAEQLSAEIAAVTVGGKTYHLDPGTPTAPFGIVSWEKANVPGYKLGKLERGVEPELITVPAQKPADALTRRVATLTLNGDTLEGTVTATFSGQEALRRRLASWGEDETARRKAIEDEAKGWFPDGAVIKVKELAGATSHDEPLVAKLDVTLASFVSSAGSRTLLPVSVFESSARNPFSSATRTNPIYYDHPLREEDEVTITLPETMKVDALPPPAALNGGALQYANETKQDGRDIVFKRTHSVELLLLETSRYAALRNFYSAMISADQKPLVLVSQ